MSDSADLPPRIPRARSGGSGGRSGPGGEETLRSFLLRSVLPGLIATMLVAIGAFGVGWLPLDTSLVEWPVVDAMRSTLLGSIVSKGSVIIGIVLLLQAWLLLGHDVLRGRTQRLDRLWLALAGWSLPLLVVPPLFSRDVYSYFAQGKLMVSGLDPYTHGSSTVPGWFPAGVDPMWAEAPTPYGQFFLMLERGVAAFADAKPYLGALVFRLLAVIGVALLAWGVPRLARAGGIKPAKALWLGVLNPLVIMHFISGAHNDALMMGLIVAGFALAVERWPVWGVVLVTLGASIKPIGIITIPFVGLLWAGAQASWARRWRCWLMSGGIALVLFVALALATRTGFGWLNAMSTPGAVQTWLSPPTAIGMSVSSMFELVGVHRADLFVGIFRALGTVASVAILLWLCLRPEGRTPVRGAALAMFAVVALGPVVQPWYLLWCIPLFAASGLRRIELRGMLLGITVLTLWGLVTSSATQDALLKLTDGMALLAVGAVLVIVLAVSPHERRLLLGENSSDRIEPEDALAVARQRDLIIRRPEKPDRKDSHGGGREEHRGGNRPS